MSDNCRCLGEKCGVQRGSDEWRLLSATVCVCVSLPHTVLSTAFSKIIPQTSSRKCGRKVKISPGANSSPEHVRTLPMPSQTHGSHACLCLGTHWQVSFLSTRCSRIVWARLRVRCGPCDVPAHPQTAAGVAAERSHGVEGTGLVLETVIGSICLRRRKNEPKKAQAFTSPGEQEDGS